MFGKFDSKFIELCKKEGLSSGDDALVMRSLIKGAFSYKTRDMHLLNIGKIVEGAKKFTVKYEDIIEVLSSISYPMGAIVVEGYYKKVDKEGGYDLVFTPVTELPAEYPSSINEEQLISLLKEGGSNRARIVEYVEEHNEAGLISEFFMNRITPIVAQLDLKSSELERFETVRSKISFSVIKKTITEDTESFSILKKAGLK